MHLIFLHLFVAWELISFYCYIIFHCMNVPQFVYPSTYLFTYWNTFFASKFWQLSVKLPWTFMYKLFLYIYAFISLGEKVRSGIVRGVLGQRISVYLTFKANAKWFFEVVVAFYLLTGNSEFHLLHVISDLVLSTIFGQFYLLWIFSSSLWLFIESCFFLRAKNFRF